MKGWDGRQILRSALHRAAREGKIKILIEVGWTHSTDGAKWVNPRTGMHTDLQGALDRESLRRTFLREKERVRLVRDPDCKRRYLGIKTKCSQS